MLVDFKVFSRKKWIRPILDAARAGYIVPIWSPRIISEATRILTWRWLERNGLGVVRIDPRLLDEQTRAWFRVMTLAFEVAEDHPAYSDQWIDSPAAPWDVPLWNAAMNGRVDIVVTTNMDSAPPADERGLRTYKNVLFMHPDLFVQFLRVVTDLFASRGLMTLEANPELAPLVAAEEMFAPTSGPEAGEDDVSPYMRNAIEDILEQAEVKNTAREKGHASRDSA